MHVLAGQRRQRPGRRRAAMPAGVARPLSGAAGVETGSLTVHRQYTSRGGLRVSTHGFNTATPMHVALVHQASQRPTRKVATLDGCGLLRNGCATSIFGVYYFRL